MRLNHMEKREAQNLIKRSLNGDVQAFSELIEAHYDMIFKVAYKWCGNAANAEDVTQEVCIKVGQSLTHFRMEASFSSWLYRITVNAVRDMQRKAKPNTDLDAVAEPADTSANAEEQLENQALWQTVRRLPEKQADAVLYVYAEGLSHAEAAEIMECKESTVSWYIHEAKKQLKEWMQHDG